MKAPWYMKISFKEQTGKGWIEVPPNKEVELPCYTWVKPHGLVYVYAFFKLLLGLLKFWRRKK